MDREKTEILLTVTTGKELPLHFLSSVSPEAHRCDAKSRPVAARDDHPVGKSREFLTLPHLHKTPCRNFPAGRLSAKCNVSSRNRITL
jgi:hypothetical protein